jgi:hypothetical protein
MATAMASADSTRLARMWSSMVQPITPSEHLVSRVVLVVAVVLIARAACRPPGGGAASVGVFGKSAVCYLAVSPDVGMLCTLSKTARLRRALHDANEYVFSTVLSCITGIYAYRGTLHRGNRGPPLARPASVRPRYAGFGDLAGAHVRVDIEHRGLLGAGPGDDDGPSR